MPRNSSGTYTLPSAYNPVITNTTILTLWWNTTGVDIQDQITSSLDRSGRGGMLAALKLTDGTAPAPGLSFNNDSASGLARLASSQFSVIIGGVETVRFTGTITQALGNFSVAGTMAVTGVATFTAQPQVPTGVDLTGGPSAASQAYVETAAARAALSVVGNLNTSTAAIAVCQYLGLNA